MSETSNPASPRRIAFDLALLVAALGTPIALAYLNSPMGLNFADPRHYESIPVVGGVVVFALRTIITIYSWPLRAGSAGADVALFGLYPLFAAAFALTRRYREAVGLLLLPLLASWLLFAAVNEYTLIQQRG